MTVPRWTTLLTDFGSRDPFVGIMKGVIAGLAPHARVIDLSHHVAPQNVEQGGWLWAQAVPFFPVETIHVAVVDPGVGSARDILVAQTSDAFFIAPDNGILGYVVDRAALRALVSLRDPRYFLAPVSETFHGRDIFAPVAAHISRGVPLRSFGPPKEDPVWLEPPAATRRPAGGSAGAEEVIGRIMDIDRFGNCQTNVRLSPGDPVLEIRVGGQVLAGLSRCYTDVPVGDPLALVGSSGFLEVSVSQGRADEQLRLAPGLPVTVLLGAR